MKGFGPFLAGAVIGGGAVFATLSYHFLQTKDGFEAIPKLSPTFAEAYVDVRTFTTADWSAHKALSTAVVKANRGGLIGDTVVDGAVQAVQGVLPQALPSGIMAPN